ncbi:energy transducer TonB [Paracoccus sp. (in: a-proteobacteria)]|uniref:energy transducer TonB family protein n=1 Tax=Paracoccus sp. TaxID=267 RepID=UPI00396C5BA0
MISRRTLETAGFFTIAAALHVSAAAIMLPDRLERGTAAEAPPAALAAGGEEIQSLVSEWEAPPEVAAAADLAEPQPITEPEPPVRAEPREMPPLQTAMVPPPLMVQPDPTPVRPNLPEPPAPEPERERIDPADLDLPELQEFTPPRIDVEPSLTLEASARPDRRPERRRPKPQRQPDPEPSPQRQQAAREAPAAAQPAQRAGQGGQAQSSSAGGGGGGSSAATRASAMAQWEAQIQACIARQLSRIRGGSTGRVIANISITRNGRIQGVSLAGGTGDPRADLQILRGIQRVRSCPAAPAAVTDPAFTFQQPFAIY